jgi:hypothetical protein
VLPFANFTPVCAEDEEVDPQQEVLSAEDDLAAEA